MRRGKRDIIKGKARGSSATGLWNAWNPLTERGPFHALKVDIHLYFPLANNLIVKFMSLLIFFIISSITISYNVMPADAILHLYSIYCIMADLFPALLYYTDLRCSRASLQHVNTLRNYCSWHLSKSLCIIKWQHDVIWESLVSYGNNYLARLVRHWSLKRV